MPIHIADHTVFRSPLSDFRRAVEGATDLATEVRYLERGEPWRFALGG